MNCLVADEAQMRMRSRVRQNLEATVCVGPDRTTLVGQESRNLGGSAMVTLEIAVGFASTHRLAKAGDYRCLPLRCWRAGVAEHGGQHFCHPYRSVTIYPTQRPRSSEYLSPMPLG